MWENGSSNPNTAVRVSIDGDDVRLRKYQAASIEMITKGKSGTLYYDTVPSQWACTVYANKEGRAIVEIDPGLGKSRIAIECYKFLRPQRTKVLVVCSKKSLNTWRREFQKWHPTIKEQDIQIVEGDPYTREQLWGDTNKVVYVVTYQSGMRDTPYWTKHNFDFVICDECKLFINRKTQAYKYWSSYLKKIPQCIMMDGTLVKRGPQDLWGCLHILDPKLFSSYWRFVNTFCLVIEGFFGKEIVGPKNTEALGQVLASRFIRLRASDPEVSSQRPPLSRDALEVEHTTEIRKLYDQLTEEMLIETEDRVILAPSQMAIIMRHRQLLCCPAIIDPKLGIGAAMEDFIMRLEDDPHPVLFTPFKKAIPFFSRAIQDAGYPEPYILMGGMKSTEIRHVEEGFNSPQHQDRTCIVTIKFAESFELYTARRAFFIGYEWAQLENFQAEKRLHRLITPHPVQIWYYLHRGTVDEQLLMVLNRNQANVNITFQDYIKIVREAADPATKNNLISL